MSSLVFLAGSAASALAQENLLAMIKKCESMNDVDLTVMTQPKHWKERNNMTIVKFKNPQLEKEFQTAFMKDKDNASNLNYMRENGKTNPQIITFLSDGRELRFIFGEENDKTVVSFFDKYW